jgi:hypothetical protein
MPVELLDLLAGADGTRLVGKIELDTRGIATDLAAVEGDYNLAYRAYASGTWEALMLANRTGKAADAMSCEYEGRAVITELGKKTPAIVDLICRSFRLSKLKSARLFRVAECGMIVGHTDYNEFKRGFLRIHVVLRTHAGAFNAEDDLVYHMKEGEIWFLDGRRPHSAGTTTADERVHLVLDFDPAAKIDEVVDFEARAGAWTLVPTVVTRKPLTLGEECALNGLAPLLTDFTFDSIFGLLARIHVLRDEPVSKAYVRLMNMARASGDEGLVVRARKLRVDMLGR